MSNPDDLDLQRFLNGKDGLSAALRERPVPVPPPALDEAILEAARREAERPLRPRWLVPMSVAATVILGVGLSVKLAYQPAPLQQSVPETELSAVRAPAASGRSGAQGADASSADFVPSTRPTVDDIPRLEFDDDTLPRRAYDTSSSNVAREAAQAREDGDFLPRLPQWSATPPSVSVEGDSAPPADRADGNQQMARRRPAPVPAAAAKLAEVTVAPEAAETEPAVVAAVEPMATARPTNDLADTSAADAPAVALARSFEAASDDEMSPHDILIAETRGLAALVEMLSQQGRDDVVLRAQPNETADKPADPVSVQLQLIRRLHDLGYEDEARRSLKRLATRVGSLALPDDYPLPHPDADDSR